jgi:hypothetical protein
MKTENEKLEFYGPNFPLFQNFIIFNTQLLKPLVCFAPPPPPRSMLLAKLRLCVQSVRLSAVRDWRSFG